MSYRPKALASFSPTGWVVSSDVSANQATASSDSASALAQVEAAQPTFQKVTPYVTISGSSTETAAFAKDLSTSTGVKPYKTLIASPPTQLEIDGVSATAVTPTPGSKT
jgi:hypothetical protein